ncbi:MAG: hypothetical protein GX442_20395 [Candidatus Riflebacteria bacterium]|nr:hypothetical protein [Candidatus Riflebacteria bacterium]
MNVRILSVLALLLVAIGSALIAQTPATAPVAVPTEEAKAAPGLSRFGPDGDFDGDGIRNADDPDRACRWRSADQASGTARLRGPRFGPADATASSSFVPGQGRGRGQGFGPRSGRGRGRRCGARFGQGRGGRGARGGTGFGQGSGEGCPRFGQWKAGPAGQPGQGGRRLRRRDGSCQASPPSQSAPLLPASGTVSPSN